MFRTQAPPDLARLKKQIHEQKRRLHERLNSSCEPEAGADSGARLRRAFAAAFGGEPASSDVN